MHPAILAATLSTLGWLAGDWETTSGQACIEEHWTRPAAGTMLAVNRTIVGERTAFFEFLRIEARGDGLVYVAQPRGAPPTDFRATRVTATEVVFENPAHDFPKRISYRREADGSVTARVEGDGSEKEKAEDFRFRPAGKAACAAGPRSSP